MHKNSCACDEFHDEALVNHVRNCGKCHVLHNGSVLYCSMANMIIQGLRKEKFFGKVKTLAELAGKGKPSLRTS